MWFSKENTPPLPKAETVLSVAASLAASAVLFRAIVNDVIPDAVSEYIHAGLRRISTRLSSQATVVIEEFDGFAANQMFKAGNVYLGSMLSPSAPRIKVKQREKEKELEVGIDKNQELIDVFEGVKLWWILVTSRVQVSNRKQNDSTFPQSELRYFEVSFGKKHKDMVLRSYLPYVLQRANALREEKKTLKLYTIDYNGTDYWGSINFDHPATLENVAMEPEMKKSLIDDLDRFRQRKVFYRRVGKTWKRGYLLYGPPGTGKTSLIAAMANYLKFDVYDLDLREIQCNSDLRRLLIGTGNRSMLVIEDIDRSFESVEEDKITLSALLNFIDGLWSSCGNERILVFTTNHKDQLDPALFRPGRMDLHLHMSYCTSIMFHTLASNYLQIQEHHLFGEIEELLDRVQVTPAEVAGELVKSEDPGLIKFLHNKRDI